MTGETWRIVPSAPQFMASNEGRIMVQPYLAEMPHGGFRQYGGQPYFGVWSKIDERFIVIHKGKTYKVARLVCEAFHGECPQDKPVCMHLDENSANNRSDNLSWGSQKENLEAPAHQKYKRLRGKSEDPWLDARISISAGQP